MDEQIPTDCTRPTGRYTAYCETDHNRLGFLRCHECEGCEQYRKVRIVRKISGKLINFLGTKRRVVNKLTLWTLGTSLDDDKFNRITIKAYMDEFRKVWRKYCISRNRKTTWLFYVIEAGSRGNKLHIHMINYGFVHQKEVLAIWRGITGELSNINFSKRRRSGSVQKISNYMSKYLGKEGNSRRNYYYLGDLVRIEVLEPKSICGVKLLKGGRCLNYVYMFIVHHPDSISKDKFHPPLDGLPRKYCEKNCFVISPSSGRGGILQVDLELKTIKPEEKKKSEFCNLHHLQRFLKSNVLAPSIRGRLCDREHWHISPHDLRFSSSFP